MFIRRQCQAIFIAIGFWFVSINTVFADTDYIFICVKSEYAIDLAKERPRKDKKITSILINTYIEEKYCTKNYKIEITEKEINTFHQIGFKGSVAYGYLPYENEGELRFIPYSIFVPPVGGAKL